jgi:acyl-CoA thioesterase-1
MKYFFWLFFCLWTSISFADHRILFLGDSLTEGYGVMKEESFPSLLEVKLQDELKMKGLKIINAGIGGATSASGLSRLEWHLKTKITHLIIALGSNDALRGLKPSETLKNLELVINRAQAAPIKILLLGAKAPPNYSKKFTNEFDGLFLILSKKYRIPLVPFILEGVAGNPKLNQADGIHPNPTGNKIIADKLLKPIKDFL